MKKVPSESAFFALWGALFAIAITFSAEFLMPGATEVFARNFSKTAASIAPQQLVASVLGGARSDTPSSGRNSAAGTQGGTGRTSTSPGSTVPSSRSTTNTTRTTAPSGGYSQSVFGGGSSVNNRGSSNNSNTNSGINSAGNRATGAGPGASANRVTSGGSTVTRSATANNTSGGLINGIFNAISTVAGIFNPFGSATARPMDPRTVVATNDPLGAPSGAVQNILNNLRLPSIFDPTNPNIPPTLTPGEIRQLEQLRQQRFNPLQNPLRPQTEEEWNRLLENTYINPGQQSVPSIINDIFGNRSLVNVLPVPSSGVAASRLRPNLNLAGAGVQYVTSGNTVTVGSSAFEALGSQGLSNAFVGGLYSVGGALVGEGFSSDGIVTENYLNTVRARANSIWGDFYNNSTLSNSTIPPEVEALRQALGREAIDVFLSSDLEGTPMRELTPALLRTMEELQNELNQIQSNIGGTGSGLSIQIASLRDVLPGGVQEFTSTYSPPYTPSATDEYLDAAYASRSRDYVTSAGILSTRALDRVQTAFATADIKSDLAFGSTGPQVGALQKYLKSAGFYVGAVTSIFDPSTQSALRSYQQRKGLTADGKVGPQTKNAFAQDAKYENFFMISQLQSKLGLKITGEWSVPTIEGYKQNLITEVAKWRAELPAGHSGHGIGNIQMYLKLSGYYDGFITEVLDAPTMNALSGFQMERGIPVTGIIDTATRDAFQKENKAVDTKVIKNFQAVLNIPQTGVMDQPTIDAYNKFSRDYFIARSLDVAPYTEWSPEEKEAMSQAIIKANYDTEVVPLQDFTHESAPLESYSFALYNPPKSGGSPARIQIVSLNDFKGSNASPNAVTTKAGSITLSPAVTLSTQTYIPAGNATQFSTNNSTSYLFNTPISENNRTSSNDSSSPSCSMTTSRSSIVAGQSTTLLWSSLNTVSVEIINSRDETTLTRSPSGIETVTPQGSVIYRGTFRGKNGGTIVCGTSLTVQGSAPGIGPTEDSASQGTSQPTTKLAPEVPSQPTTYTPPQETPQQPALGTGQIKIAFLISGSSFTVPADWNPSANVIEVIGGGAGGSGSRYGGGGGGGAYSRITNLALTPGATVTYKVGTGGGAGASGTDTYFNGVACASSPVCAKGGATGNGGAGGAGGSETLSIGDIKYSGGKGGTSIGGSNAGNGGGAAGPFGIGGAGGGSLAEPNGHGGTGGAGKGGIGANGVTGIAVGEAAGNVSFPGGNGIEWGNAGSGGGGASHGFGGDGGYFGGGGAGRVFNSWGASGAGAGAQGLVVIIYRSL